jgi:hypothetical protein
VSTGDRNDGYTGKVKSVFYPPSGIPQGNGRSIFYQLVKAVSASGIQRIAYPPDKQEKATQTVLEQAEVLPELWSVS